MICNKRWLGPAHQFPLIDNPCPFHLKHKRERPRSIGLGRSAAWVVAGAEPLSPATRMEPGAKGWLAWCGLPSRPLEARALLKRGAIACPPLLRFNGACPSLPAAARCPRGMLARLLL